MLLKFKPTLFGSTAPVKFIFRFIVSLVRIRSILSTALDSTESTMDDASEAARSGAPDGHVVLADRQTRGRGAHGRSWVSPAGTDLYFSIVARPNVDPSSIALVTLATGLGVRDAVAELIPGRRVGVKWPNDIWIEHRKCAGILVESRMLGSRIEAAIIGSVR